MNEETELKYKVGDVVLVKAKITLIDEKDAVFPYKAESERDMLWIKPSEIVGLAPKEEA